MDRELKKTLSENLKKQLEANGLTQKQLCGTSFSTKQTVSSSIKRLQADGLVEVDGAAEGLGQGAGHGLGAVVAPRVELEGARHRLLAGHRPPSQTARDSPSGAPPRTWMWA